MYLCTTFILYPRYKRLLVKCDAILNRIAEITWRFFCLKESNFVYCLVIPMAHHRFGTVVKNDATRAPSPNAGKMHLMQIMRKRMRRRVTKTMVAPTCTTSSPCSKVGYSAHPPGSVQSPERWRTPAPDQNNILLSLYICIVLYTAVPVLTFQYTLSHLSGFQL